MCAFQVSSFLEFMSSGCAGGAQVRKVLECSPAGQEEGGPPAGGGKRGQTGDRSSDRSLGNLVFERAILIADHRIALVAELVEALVVRPHVLRELELADEAAADHERGNPALRGVVG